MKLHFDTVIIGAGSAGAVLARRLSDDASCNVCLVEAGDWPDDPDIADPLQWPRLAGREYDWAFRTAPQPHTANRTHDWPRGRIVGGSGCLNAMAHVRGHPADFVAWESAGGADWSFEAMLPAFIRSENFSAFEHPARGREGPLDVFLPSDTVSPVAHAFMEAGRAIGAPSPRDHNCGPMTGATPNSLNTRDGSRLTAADAYLTPAVRARANLTILTGCAVERLEIKDARAVGLTGAIGDEPVALAADRIVICAGAVSTPLILMRSGIGDPETLSAASIACKIEAREVGRNLQDHLLGLGNVYLSREPVPPSRLQHSESLMYLDSQEIGCAQGRPDIVLACVVAPSVAPGLEAPPDGSAYTILFGATEPASRGTIRPGGAHLRDTPVIDPHYLEEEQDRVALRRAFLLAREVGHHEALGRWRAREVLPGIAVRSDSAVDAFIARAACTHHHPCGTCRMGLDEAAVVGPDLRVNGLDNLFVVDASIFPRITSGPINAAVVAVAEHWAATFSS